MSDGAEILGSVRWTAETRARCLPRRGGANPAVPYDAAVDLATVRGGDEIAAKAFSPQGALADLTRRALASFDGAATSLARPLDVDEQGALAVMLGARGQVLRREAIPAALLRAWVAIGGAELAVRALARTWTLVGRDAARPYTLDLDSIARETTGRYFLAAFPFGAAWFAGTSDAWELLRAALASVDDAAYGRARAAADAARAGVPVVPRWTTNVALPGERAALEVDLAELRTAKTFPAVLLACIDDPAASAAWAKESARFGAEDHACTLVDLLGASAVPSLAALFDAVKGKDARQRIAAAAALVETDEAARLFVDWLAAKEVTKLATSWLTSHAKLARPALEAAAHSKSKAADLAGAVLASLPPVHGAAPIAKIEAPAARETSGVDAPTLLRDPPWRRAKPKIAPRVLALTPIDVPVIVEWAEGERASLLDTVGAWLEQRKPNWGEAMIRRYAYLHGWQGELLAYLPEEEGLKLWNEKDPKWHLCNVEPDFVGWVLAKHGDAALPGVHRVAGAHARLLPPMKRVRSPELVRTAAHVFHRLKTGKADAFAYLAARAELATTTLLPLALGKPTKDREMAEATLRALAAADASRVIGAAGAYGAEAVAALEAMLASEPEVAAWPDKPPKLPAFAAPASLPAVHMAGGRALDEAETTHLLELLAIAPLDRRDVVAPVRAALDASSAAAFGWALFSAWLVAGAPAKDAFAFLALGHLGENDTARRLTPMIRSWPGESLHARAVQGLDVLGAIGSDLALVHLSGVAQKVKFKALQDRAREKIDAIAAARGLTADELADRLVPDVGLDARGEMVLDYGARSFRVVFDEALTPVVVDAANKRARTPPKPAKSDDAARAKEALEAFATLKKDVKAIARQEIVRLERAMCSRRRWSVEAFQSFVAHQPLVRHLAARLVFATYDAAGRAVTTFRVAEDGSFAGVDDDATTLAADASIGVAHRLDLDDGLLARWGDRLASYELLAPFEQLGRAVYALDASERAAREIKRFAGLKVKTGKVRGLLDGGAWRTGPPQDSGGIWWLEARLGRGAVAGVEREIVAELRLAPGLSPGDASADQELGALAFADEGVTFGAVDSVVMSELLRDLELLRA